MPERHDRSVKSWVARLEWPIFNDTIIHWNKNTAFSPSSSSFVMVMVLPLSTLTTENRGEAERERGSEGLWRKKRDEMNGNEVL